MGDVPWLDKLGKYLSDSVNMFGTKQDNKVGFK